MNVVGIDARLTHFFNRINDIINGNSFRTAESWLGLHFTSASKRNRPTYSYPTSLVLTDPRDPPNPTKLTHLHASDTWQIRVLSETVESNVTGCYSLASNGLVVANYEEACDDRRLSPVCEHRGKEAFEISML